MKKIFVLVLFALGSCTSSEDGEFISSQNCQKPAFQKKLKKIIDYGYHSKRNTEYEYFYDQAGRLDSISNRAYALKMYYSADGLVEKVQTIYPEFRGYTYFAEYRYTNRILESIEDISVSLGGTRFIKSISYYKFDNNQRVNWEKTNSQNDYKTYASDSCNNIHTIQRFYDKDNEKHYIFESSFGEGYDPLYAIGFQKIFPGSCNPNLLATGEIVYWDCGDYEGGVRKYTHVLDSENLPIKTIIDNYLAKEYFYY